MKLLRSKTFGSCPVAASASISIETGAALALRVFDHGAVYPPSTVREGRIELNPHGEYALVSVPSTDPLTVDNPDRSGSRFEGVTYLIGARGDHGTFVLDLGRTDRYLPVETLCIVQSFPWIIRAWLHTMKLTVNNKVTQFSHHMHVSI